MNLYNDSIPVSFEDYGATAQLDLVSLCALMRLANTWRARNAAIRNARRGVSP